LSTVIRRVAGAPRPARRVLTCQHCGAVLSHEEGGVLKMRVPSRLIAFKSFDDGDLVAEIPCPRCRRDTPLYPIRLQRIVALKSPPGA